MELVATLHTINAVRDFSGSTSTFTWTVKTLTGGTLVVNYMIGIYGRIAQAFAGIAGPVWFEIGDADNSDCYMPRMNLLASRRDQELFSRGSLMALRTDASPKVYSCVNYPPYRYSPATPILTFTSDSGNLSSLTAGELEIVVPHLV